MNTSMCGMTLKAMRLVNFFASTGSETIDGAGLREQFVHRVLAGAADRLISRHNHALDLRLVVQRLQRHDELRGRAIRVGDDVLLRKTLGGVGVDLRHDQRNVRIHAPGGGIVDRRRSPARRSSAPIPWRPNRPPTSGRCRFRRNRNARAPCTSASCRRTRLRGRSNCDEASATTSETGKRRSARMASISRPTLPVAPTTATLKPDMILIPSGFGPPRAGPARQNKRILVCPGAPPGEETGPEGARYPFVPPFRTVRVVVVFEVAYNIEASTPRNGKIALKDSKPRARRPRIVKTPFYGNVRTSPF